MLLNLKYIKEFKDRNNDLNAYFFNSYFYLNENMTGISTYEGFYIIDISPKISQQNPIYLIKLQILVPRAFIILNSKIMNIYIYWDIMIKE